MAIDLSRGLYSAIIKKMPRHLRSVEDYYFLSFMVPAIVCLVLTSPLLAYAGLWRPAWSTALSSLIITGLLALWRAGVSIPWLQSFF